MSKNNIRNLSRTPISREQEQQLVDAVSTTKEPLVLTVLVSALLEHELEGLLKPMYKRSDDETWGRLTGDNGPLGTFSQKIDTAFALGLFDESVRSCLLAIKNVRNAFAHSKLLLTLDHDVVIKTVQTVKLPARKGRYYTGIRQIQTHSNGEYIYRRLFSLTYEQLVKRSTRRLRAQHRNYIRWTEVRKKEIREHIRAQALARGQWDTGEALSYADRLALMAAAAPVPDDSTPTAF